MRKRKFAVYDVFSSETTCRQSAGRRVRYGRSRRPRDAGDRRRVQPVGDDLHPAAQEPDTPRRSAHLHADARAALRRPSDRRLGDRHHRGGRRRGAVDLRAGGKGRAGSLRGVQGRRRHVRRIRPAAAAGAGSVLGRSGGDRGRTRPRSSRDRLREPCRHPVFRRRALRPGAGRRARCRGAGKPRHARLDGADRARPRRCRRRPSSIAARRSAHGNAFHARMFAGHLGIPEDPATGSAVASFAGAIMRFDQPTDGLQQLSDRAGRRDGPAVAAFASSSTSKGARSLAHASAAMR